MAAGSRILYTGSDCCSLATTSPTVSETLIFLESDEGSCKIILIILIIDFNYQKLNCQTYDHSNKALKQYFPVVLLIMLNKLVLTFEFMYKNPTAV